MKQKQMNKMSFKGREIDTILEILWKIKDDDKFYFFAYGRDALKLLSEKT